MTTNDGRQEYLVTERAGKRVAERFVTPGDVVQLTPEEAAHGLSEGTLVPKGKTLHKAFTGPSKTADTLRQDAKAFRDGAVADTVAVESSALSEPPAGKPPEKA